MKKLLLLINKYPFYILFAFYFTTQSSACCLRQKPNEVKEKKEGGSANHSEIKSSNITSDSLANLSTKKDTTKKSASGVENKHQSSNQHLLDSLQNVLDKQKGIKSNSPK
ncbi:MAG: hypothetical protein KA163_06330 [Bacteroidia bacterium]|nr:hypothetical protein [Bacteroidia bacterium]